MVVVFLLFVFLALVDSTPQFGFGGFGNSQNCLGSRCNQNNLGGGGFGGFRGGFGGYGGFGQNFGHAQNCVGSQCNQNNFGKKKREAVVDADTEHLQSDGDGVGTSEESTHSMKKLPTPLVDMNVSDTNTEDAEDRMSPVDDDQVSTDDTEFKLSENSALDEVDSDIVVLNPLRGDAGNKIVEDGSEEALVEEFELEEEVERAEEVLNLELETILDSAGWDSEKTITHENVAASEAEDTLEDANNIISIEPEETISASSIDKTTLELKETIQSLRVEDSS